MQPGKLYSGVKSPTSRCQQGQAPSCLFQLCVAPGLPWLRHVTCFSGCLLNPPQQARRRRSGGGAASDPPGKKWWGLGQGALGRQSASVRLGCTHTGRAGHAPVYPPSQGGSRPPQPGAVWGSPALSPAALRVLLGSEVSEKAPFSP